MRAVAVHPGQPNSIHLREIAMPSLESVPDGRGVLVKVLQIGVDGTDKEINAAEYGAPPPGDDYLVTGHESLGRVEQIGPNVRGLAVGDYVVATVRRPGGSIYDRIGAYDMTTEATYYERGINLRHGLMTEYYVDDPEYLVLVPPALKHIGVLLEPLSIAEKGVEQAYEIQRRLRVWRPERAAVLGAGPLGLLAALTLRLRGLEVTVMARSEPPTPNSALVEAIGARYASTRQTAASEISAQYGPFDLIFEATGASAPAFEAMGYLGKNGVLVLSGISGGGKSIEIPGDKIMLDFVLGNKVVVGTVNANRVYFERGVQDMALAEAQFNDWLPRLLTHPLGGLDDYRELYRLLTEDKSVIKTFLRVAE